MRQRVRLQVGRVKYLKLVAKLRVEVERRCGNEEKI